MQHEPFVSRCVVVYSGFLESLESQALEESNCGQAHTEKVATLRASVFGTSQAITDKRTSRDYGGPLPFAIWILRITSFGC